MLTAPEIARSLDLHRAGSGWRGSCPACGYATAFLLTSKAGQARGWCASCGDTAAVADALARLDGSAARYMPRATERPPPDNAARTSRALRLWNAATPPGGTPASRDLARRCVAHLLDSDALRFLRDCPHPNGARLPALVALAVDARGKPVAIHRTFLRGDGSGKAEVEPVKATLGPVSGSAVRLAPLAAEIVLGEGIETVASAGLLLGFPAWSGISAGNLARTLALPREVRAVVVAADPDDPGMRAACGAARRWKAEGRRVRIATPNQRCADFNDLLMEARANG
jgi:putative DNA primase/helicase